MSLRLLLASSWVLFSASLLAADDPPESVERHCLRIQVLLVESPGVLGEETRVRLSGPTNEVMETVSKLEKEKRASIVNHVDMSVLDDYECMLQIGETVAVRSGTTRLGSGREQNSYRDVDTGTIVQLRTRVSGDQVMVEIDFSKSAVKPWNEEDSAPQGVSQLTHQTTIQVKDGHAMPVGRMMQQTGDHSKAYLFVVSAEILDSSNVQVMKLQSFSRPPVKEGREMASGTPGVSSVRFVPTRPSSTQLSEEAIQERSGRIAEAIFKRADKDNDGVISKDEIAGLRPRDSKLDAPIDLNEFTDWFTSYLQSAARRSSGRGYPSSGFRRPTNSPRSDRADDEANDSEDTDRQPEGTKTKGDGDDAGEVDPA